MIFKNALRRDAFGKQFENGTKTTWKRSRNQGKIEPKTESKTETENQLEKTSILAPKMRPRMVRKPSKNRLGIRFYLRLFFLFSIKMWVPKSWKICFASRRQAILKTWLVIYGCAFVSKNAPKIDKKKIKDITYSNFDLRNNKKAGFMPAFLFMQALI
mgnify:CR=1 FL=1